jgi:hypothetical protein
MGPPKRGELPGRKGLSAYWVVGYRVEANGIGPTCQAALRRTRTQLTLMVAGLPAGDRCRLDFKRSDLVCMSDDRERSEIWLRRIE